MLYTTPIFLKIPSDVRRYLLAVLGLKCANLLFEVRTLLVKNEGDNSRLLLFERPTEFPCFHFKFSGTIYNLNDISGKLNEELF